eukprot:4760250-Prymnesium_polylepis.1
MARPHDGLALWQFARARWCDCSTACWSHACPGTRLSGQCSRSARHCSTHSDRLPRTTAHRLGAAVN